MKYFLPRAQIAPWSSNCLHGGGGQVGVLILQRAVQSQPPLLLVFTQNGRDGQSVFIGVVGLHCLSAKKKKTNRNTSDAALVPDLMV